MKHSKSIRRWFSVILTAIALNAQADMGPPTIQAICKVTTTDGKTYEGFVTLIIGGLHGIHSNGFYLYEDDHYNWTSLFDYSFTKLEKVGDNRYRMGNFVPDAKRICFLACVWDRDNYWLKEEKKIQQEAGQNFLLTKSTVQRKYLMLDTLPLFTELPKYLYLDYNDRKLKRHNIAMKDIASFEIVLQPSQTLLTEIDKKKKALIEEESAADSTGDFPPPTWVHELVKYPERLEELKKEFKDWYRK